jgi:NAD(P)-dependent dehydrogenase (short-subunit alcohol dehydrogenase family)
VNWGGNVVSGPDFRRMMDTNLTGAFIMSQAVLSVSMPAGDAEKNSIVHVSSTRALQSEPGSEAYAASKAGLIGLTHAQAGPGHSFPDCLFVVHLHTSAAAERMMSRLC